MKNRIRIITVAFIFGLFAATAFSATASADDGKSIALESFGAAFGLAVYNTQVIIGISADTVSKNVYTNDEITSILSEQKGALDALKDSVNKINDAGIAKDETALLVEMLGTLDKIQETITALNNYLADSTTDNANIFETKRVASYNAIAHILGLEETK